MFIGTSAPNVHIVHADADYAMDLDDWRSKIDFVLFLNNTPVAWGSRKQPSSSSTTEAEYVSVVTTTKEIVWLRRLLDKLGCLNQAPQSFIQKTRVQIILFIPPGIVIELNIQYRIVHKAHKNDLIQLQYVPTHDQIADIFTKPLHVNLFAQLRALLGVTNSLESGRM